MTILCAFPFFRPSVKKKAAPINGLEQDVAQGLINSQQVCHKLPTESSHTQKLILVDNNEVCL